MPASNVALTAGSPTVSRWQLFEFHRPGSAHVEDIARLLFESIESPAAAFKARGIPEALRIVEVMGITQARKWRVCTVSYSSYRKCCQFRLP